MQQLLTRVVDLFYPPQCVGCRELTDAAHGLCPACWLDTNFISGTICDCCGMPVPVAISEQVTLCESCVQHPPSWSKGRAAVLYEGTGRRVVLSLKHGDRLDLAHPVATWMARAGADLIACADIVAPVPLHWTRLFRRRFNQSAELARQPQISAKTKHIPDLLTRIRRTQAQEGMNRQTRAETQSGAMVVTKRHASRIEGAAILLIDDVMTSGATLSNCAEALNRAGAKEVNVLVVARVAREVFSPI